MRYTVTIRSRETGEVLGTEKFQQELRAKHRCEELNRWFKNYEATWEAR